MLTLWIGASLAPGAAGALGLLLRRVRPRLLPPVRKPVIQHIDRKWTYLSFAVLLAVVLTSAATLSPTYCVWLCPFKTVTEFPKVESFLTAVQAVIFVSLFSVLVVALPVLTRRRVQCGLFSPHRLPIADQPHQRVRRADRSPALHRCGRCIRGCPTFSLDEMSVRVRPRANHLHEVRRVRRCLSQGRGWLSCPRHPAGKPPGAGPAAISLRRLSFRVDLRLGHDGAGLGAYLQAGRHRQHALGALR